MFTNRKILILVVLVLITVFAVGAWNTFAQDAPTTPPCDFGQMYGMMNGRGTQGRGMGMMNGGNVPEDCLQNGFCGMGMMGGMMNQQMGMGGMMGFNPETMGRFGPGAGMMGSWTPPSELAPTGETLTLDEAVAIAQSYIAQWDSETPLELGEVMQFDNHFYAMALETESGKGAFEFLIDAESGNVYGEPGPNMMWNLQYGMSIGRGIGMFPAITDAEMTVSIEQARENAQSVLDDVLPGTTVDATEADTFYGYYTLHILQDGNVIGMLSVNGYSGQVWLHHWHGNFVDMTE